MSRVFGLLLLGSAGLLAQGVTWLKWDEALLATRSTGKIIMIDAVRDGCHFCVDMDNEVFEDAQDLFALAKRVEKGRHRPQFKRMCPEPHQMALDARQLGQEHPDPLGLGRNLQVQQSFDGQAESQVVGEWR